MFSSGPNYTKLKTNLRLAINRLKLLEKKKIELTQKSRKEIADYISSGKVERARIRVEHIIREDYMVEAMEMLEMYCDLLLARFGLLQQMKTVDPGLEEAISSVLWAGPRLVADVPELKPICEQLTHKYGKEYAESCKVQGTTVSEKLRHRLGVQAPSKLLTEKYLIEISKNFNVDYEPDKKVMKEAESMDLLLDLDSDNKNNLGGGGGGGGMNITEPPGFKGFPQIPMVPSADFQLFNSKFPSSSQTSQIGGFVVPPASDHSPSSNVNASSSVPFSYNIPPSGDEDIGKQLNLMPDFDGPPPSYSNFAPNVNETPPDSNKQNSVKPKPTPRSKISPPSGAKPKNTDILFPELPNVPDDAPHMSNHDFTPKNDTLDEVDFDDLSKRFENLKKKK